MPRFPAIGRPHSPLRLFPCFTGLLFMNSTNSRWVLFLLCGLALAFGAEPPRGLAESPGDETPASDAPFRAGAVAIDITPDEFPRIIAGYFLEQQASQVSSRLYARGFVLSDGTTKIAMVVVDTCMMTQQLIEQAKELAAQQCDIPVDHMMVSATHTHSAPAAMGCLGTRVDEQYATWLPGKIAEAIVAADANLQPAQIGWAAIDDWEHTHNRRWIRRPENLIVDPFGNATGRAHMHPGYQSADVIGPSGPVDPGLTVLSLQTPDGRPLAVFANYSQHFFGSPAISADYYGQFCSYVADMLDQPGEGNGPFVCAMSQGTSGDLMWMDYGSPAKQLSMERYAEAVAQYAQKALASIRYHRTAPLAVVEKRLTLKYRVPDQARLDWARPIAETIEDEVPKSLPQVYAMEALILHERQTTELKLQAIRIGDLTITTLPNEVYALTGLKLKAQAPLAMHMNVELANGAEGYIPPPEQHVLGGYTTWPARTAGLEVDAEPNIVETLLGALEQATGAPRRAMEDEHGPYAAAIIDAKPESYWRLGDAQGTTARNAVPGGRPANVQPGFAWYLPGAGSGSGIGDQQRLTPSAFSGPDRINRCIHLAGGSLQAEIEDPTQPYSIALWFWLGERSGASERSGSLVALPSGESLVARQGSDHRVQLQLGDRASDLSLRADDWHFAVLVCDGEQMRVYVDGDSAPALTAPSPLAAAAGQVQFGVGLQGKLDEIAVFGRALTLPDVQALWQASGIPEQRLHEQAMRERIERELAERVKPPKFPDGYEAVVAQMNPVMASALAAAPDPMRSTGHVAYSPETFATFRDGTLSGELPTLGNAYSVSLWFRSETPNDVQPVTAYFFSRGPDGDGQAPGDHLGIGGTYRQELVGKLLFFNGNRSDQVAAGQTVIPPETWNHVVLVRDGDRVTAWLNGQPAPEIDSQIEVTVDGPQPFFLGARSDHFAPLRGQLAHFALFDRPLSPAEAKQLHSASGRPVGTAMPLPRPAPEPASEPLSATESLNGIHVPTGFRVELVAAEPDVLDPVAFDWDAAGRLWVVEMADYPLGMDGQGKPGGRIRVLEDPDGDGHYDRSSLFADGLNFPTGILTWRGGVLVTAAPEILLLRDTNGDGQADSREVLYEGFNEGNQQLRINGLRWGLDGWVYCANGGHHAGHGVGTQVRSRRDGRMYEIGSRDFRFRPDTGELELESGPTQYGRNRDAWGNWFGTQNAKPLWHYVIADRYLSRNPFAPAPQPIRHILSPDSPVVFPASAPEKRYHSFDQSGRFTSACGGMIEGDNRLFGDSVESHAFICEPFHNLVQHQILNDAGISFVARRAEGEEDRDFFASTDRWCRPVMVRSGPDGGLWIADMYRYMIEHPEWLPSDGKAELLPHYRLGENQGRIYRVVSAATGRRETMRLDQLNLEQLVAALDSPSGWQRDKVQQMLMWHTDRAAIPLLENLYRSASRPQVRVQTLWTLQGLEALESSLLIEALGDEHPRVRQAAVRLSEQRDEADVIRAATELARDPDAKVRLQLALSCGQWSDHRAGIALAEIATSAADDPLLVAAILSSMVPHLDTFLSATRQPDSQIVEMYRQPLLRQALRSNDDQSIARMLDNALAAPQTARAARLGDLLISLERVGSSLDQLATSESAELRTRVGLVRKQLESAVATIDDATQDDDRRLAAAMLLSRSADHRPASVEALAQWLQPQIDVDTQAAVIASLGQSAEGRVPDILGDAWPQMTPKLRADALAVWMSRSGWTNDLLERIERGEILPSDLEPVQQAHLKNHPDEQIAQRAGKTFATDQGGTPGDLVQRYREALTLVGDPVQGERVYQNSCVSCHRRGEVGHAIGPDLATVRHHPAEKLLVNILDPNADIQPGYQVYNCLLDSGEVISGILTGETANSLTITSANGMVRTVGRDEITELRNLNISMMPGGLHENLTLQEVADLIALLKQPTPKNP